jgi:hypothetical protein
MDGIGLYRKGLGIKFWINLAEIFVCCRIQLTTGWMYIAIGLGRQRIECV